MREAELLQILGDFDGALRAFEECHGYMSARAEPRTRIVSLLNVGVASTLCGDAVRGKALAQEALDQARAIGYAVLEASALEDLALAHATGGDYPAAIAAMERAVAMRTETLSIAWTGMTLAQLALWYVNTGAVDRARACHRSHARGGRRDRARNALAANLLLGGRAGVSCMRRRDGGA